MSLPRLLSLLAIALSIGLPARAIGIEEVLDQSRQRRLQELSQSLADGDSPRAAVVRESFARVLAALDADLSVDVLIVRGKVIAEAVNEGLIAANESLAELPEGERAFVMAHEIAHIACAHFSKRTLLFRQHVPGEVVREHTDAVAGPLAREASALAHQQELEADAFALRALKRLGYGFETAIAVFMRHGVQHDTATHPGTRKRVAHLRSLL